MLKLLPSISASGLKALSGEIGSSALAPVLPSVARRVYRLAEAVSKGPLARRVKGADDLLPSGVIVPERARSGQKRAVIWGRTSESRTD